MASVESGKYMVNDEVIDLVKIRELTGSTSYKNTKLYENNKLCENNEKPKFKCMIVPNKLPNILRIKPKNTN